MSVQTIKIETLTEGEAESLVTEVIFLIRQGWGRVKVNRTPDDELGWVSEFKSPGYASGEYFWMKVGLTHSLILEILKHPEYITAYFTRADAYQYELQKSCLK